LEKFPELADKWDFVGNTPLHLACRLHPNFSLITLIFRKTKNPWKRNWSKTANTPLEEAINTKNFSAVAAILQEGKNKVKKHLKIQNPYTKLTPFALSCQRLRKDITQILIHAGANPNEMGPHGETIFHKMEEWKDDAASEKESFNGMVRFLVDEACDLKKLKVTRESCLALIFDDFLKEMLSRLDF
jgi:hypothetical protein